MHLRQPAIDHGLIAFVWAVVVAVFVWMGGWAVGFGDAPSFVAGLVIGFFVFLFVRTHGEDEPRRPA